MQDDVENRSQASVDVDELIALLQATGEIKTSAMVVTNEVDVDEYNGWTEDLRESQANLQHDVARLEQQLSQLLKASLRASLPPESAQDQYPRLRASNNLRASNSRQQGGCDPELADQEIFDDDDDDDDDDDESTAMGPRSPSFSGLFRSMMGFSNPKPLPEENDVMDTLPEDSFSVMTASPVFSVAFASALAVALIQVGTFLLLTFNLMEKSNNPSNPFGLPANVAPAVRGTQLILLTIAVLSQDSIRTGIALIVKGYTKPMQEAFEHITLLKFGCSIVIRITEGSLGLVMTFMLIFDSTTVLDLILNFTAVEFVSQLDEIFFGLACQGFLGGRLKEQALVVRDTKFAASTKLVDPKNPSAGRVRKGKRLHWILILTWAALMGAWIALMMNQSNGKYLCQTLRIQFEDDFVSSLGAFSGLYDIDSSKSVPFQNDRVQYIDRMQGKSVFAYCTKLNAWSFSYAEDGNFPDPCTDWIARSEESETFDILETVNHQWTVRNVQGREISIEFFHMSCADCDRDTGNCNGYGICSNAICECDEGRYGSRCQFTSPCQKLEMDIRFNGFEDERKWASSFELFEVDGQLIETYHRPVYVNETEPGNFDILAFTGRRWMATHTGELLSANLTGLTDPAERRRHLGQYFNNHFHAYWSNFLASFISDPMDIGTEQNAATPVEFKWNYAKPKNGVHPHEVQQVDRSVASLDSVLLCSVCNNATNSCRNDGVCVDGQCQCLIGSFGSICQVPPTGNGRCDTQFDSPKYDYDGGDCCESTCISGDVYHCGKDETGFIDVGYFFCRHAADEWHLNRASFDRLSSETRYSMALSDDGHILTLGEPNAGHVTVFDADGSEWVRRGRVLEGPLGSQFGAHVAMSKGLKNTVKNFLTVDPVRVAASGRDRKKGFVRIYECLAEGCYQSGQDIFFDALGADSRTVHDISKDGRILAFGGFNETRNRTTVDFYHYNESMDSWTHEGTPSLDFEGDAYSVKLSGNFEILAIRSINIWQGEGKNEYHKIFLATDAKAVFHLNREANKWDQNGHTIYHHVDGSGATKYLDEFHILGTRHRLSEYIDGSNPIDISDDGKVIAVGFPFSTSDPGVHVFAYDDFTGEWNVRGETITGDDTTGFKGWSVALSGNGDVVVVGTGGPETATNTYLWDGLSWRKYSKEIPGGELSSLALSADGSVLAVGREIVEVYHRNIKPKCPNDMEWFHLSLTLDAHPEDTRWDLYSNTTGETLMTGGPYVGSLDGFPYSNAYERSTVVVETCVPKNECKVFSLYDRIDPSTDEFVAPDGMLAPGVYEVLVDGVQVAKRSLDQACDHYYFGKTCQTCPEGSHALKVLVRSCVPYYWTLNETTAGQVLVGDTSALFTKGDFSYARDGTCKKLGLDVHTHWSETCVSVAELEEDCFNFYLGPHPNWAIDENEPGDLELNHAHRNTEIVLIFDGKEINVDLALVGSNKAGPPSTINYRFGGACGQ